MQVIQEQGSEQVEGKCISYSLSRHHAMISVSSFAYNREQSTMSEVDCHRGVVDLGSGNDHMPVIGIARLCAREWSRGTVKEKRKWLNSGPCPTHPHTFLARSPQQCFQ